MGTVVGPKLGQQLADFHIRLSGEPGGPGARQPAGSALGACDSSCIAKEWSWPTGFTSCCDAQEQRDRFEQDNEERQRRGLPAYPLDERMLAALQSGLPECAGVAWGSTA